MKPKDYLISVAFVLGYTEFSGRIGYGDAAERHVLRRNQSHQRNASALCHHFPAAGGRNREGFTLHYRPLVPEVSPRNRAMHI